MLLAYEGIVTKIGNLACLYELSQYQNVTHANFFQLNFLKISTLHTRRKNYEPFDWL